MDCEKAVMVFQKKFVDSEKKHGTRLISRTRRGQIPHSINLRYKQWYFVLCLALTTEPTGY